MVNYSRFRRKMMSAKLIFVIIHFIQILINQCMDNIDTTNTVNDEQFGDVMIPTNDHPYYMSHEMHPAPNTIHQHIQPDQFFVNSYPYTSHPFEQPLQNEYDSRLADLSSYMTQQYIPELPTFVDTWYQPQPVPQENFALLEEQNPSYVELKSYSLNGLPESSQDLEYQIHDIGFEQPLQNKYDSRLTDLSSYMTQQYIPKQPSFVDTWYQPQSVAQENLALLEVHNPSAVGLLSYSLNGIPESRQNPEYHIPDISNKNDESIQRILNARTNEEQREKYNLYHLRYYHNMDPEKKKALNKKKYKKQKLRLQLQQVTPEKRQEKNRVQREREAERRKNETYTQNRLQYYIEYNKMRRAKRKEKKD